MQKTHAKDVHITDLLYPVKGYRGQLEKKGIKPKDHQKDNLKIIKAKHEEFTERKTEQEEKKKESIFAIR